MNKTKRILIFIWFYIIVFFLTAQSINAHWISLEEEDMDTIEYSIWDFLSIATQPIGKTLYVWGGGWNEEDTAAGIEAVSIGISSRWQEYFRMQNQFYNYENTRYQIHNGLDCSGYVGWTIYNLFHRTNGEKGYVMNAKKMAKAFSDWGWGSYKDKSEVTDYLPGDIMSSSTHVYIVIGSCEDGSIVVAHATPPAVQLSGTVDKKGNYNSKAMALADEYMKTYYKEWYQKYKPKPLDISFLRDYHQMRWYIGQNKIMQDKEGMRKKNAATILELLYRTKQMKSD